MGGKAKFQKHSAKELAKKQDQKSKGGGKEGIAARTTAKLAFACEICKTPSPDIKSLELHYESKHPKSPFNKEELIAKAQAALPPKEVVKTHHNGGKAAAKK